MTTDDEQYLGAAVLRQAKRSREWAMALAVDTIEGAEARRGINKPMGVQPQKRKKKAPPTASVASKKPVAALG
jgi:hypothetical protein